MVDTLLERVVPAQLNSVGSLRRETAAFLDERAEEQFRSSVLLVVSELSTNAVEALGDADAEFTLRVHDLGDRVVIDVTDSGPGFSDALSRRGAGSTTPRGRGLQIVRGLVDELSVTRHDGETRVCCTLCRTG